MSLSNRRLQQLISRYHNGNHNEYEKAELEQEIAKLGHPQKGSKPRNIWLRNTLGGGVNTYQFRYFLFSRAAQAAPLWERLNEETLSLRAAIRLFRSAKKRSKTNHIDFDEALATELREYDALPYVRTGPSGIPFRSPAPKTLKKAKDNPETKDPWYKLRIVIAEILEDRTPEDIDPALRDKLWGNVEKDIKIVIEEFQQRIYDVRKAEKTKKELSQRTLRNHLVAACRTLAIDPPKKGKKIDLAKAKRQKKRLARDYHPDTTGGDPHRTQKYQEVLEAYQVIEQYAATF